MTELAENLLSDEERERLRELPVRDPGTGYDAFGLSLDSVAIALAAARPFYERYFRVLSHGAEHVPTEGPVILAANHSGTLPFDAAMLWTDSVRKVGRVARPVGDFFVSDLPFIGTFFNRAGMVGGARENVRALLDAGEVVMIFPEGVPGIGKPYYERYRLQHWRVGHAELAIRHRAPVVPVAIVGAEEQMPQLAKLRKLGKLVGAPYLPITLTPFPLPVRYRIYYGEPIPLHERYSLADADNAEAVREAAATVKAAVQSLVDRGLAERTGIFR
ncbi:lysophospholipid acyltransferase family protein [Vulgatibacter incomptus]|uniref:1-acyl-sn-glycerol-3-phosphate acyltransferase n=1 Tax=Vulgatibacter incomptus TaxID=1391653 RepID=A0A0K1PHC5_9BACT|nr:lysophospholipid acyltransferase family protein [Vulgatibacter incomptus]AKU92524.1 1-acyl-sn-glycerol-3-phosphate acyltransferase [Vulgatibacter incomptus]